MMNELPSYGPECAVAAIMDSVEGDKNVRSVQNIHFTIASYLCVWVMFVMTLILTVNALID